MARKKRSNSYHSPTHTKTPGVILRHRGLILTFIYCNSLPEP